MIKIPIDMPNNCNECYFLEKNIRWKEYRCSISVYGLGRINDYIDDRHENCPLVEVEE